MMTAVIQLLTGTLGSLGFAVLFRVPRKYLVTAASGGFIGWGVYLLGMAFFNHIFVACLISAICCAVYAEIFARIKKVPALVFLVPSLIPLVPGSNLYYTLNGIAASNWEAANLNAKLTLDYALAIAVGISVVWAFQVFCRNMKARIH